MRPKLHGSKIGTFKSKEMSSCDTIYAGGKAIYSDDSLPSTNKAVGLPIFCPASPFDVLLNMAVVDICKSFNEMLFL